MFKDCDRRAVPSIPMLQWSAGSPVLRQRCFKYWTPRAALLAMGLEYGAPSAVLRVQCAEQCPPSTECFTRVSAKKRGRLWSVGPCRQIGNNNHKLQEKYEFAGPSVDGPPGCEKYPESCILGPLLLSTPVLCFGVLCCSQD